MLSDLQNLQTEVIEGLSSIDKRMSNMIEHTKDGIQQPPPTKTPPEHSTNQNPPNSEPESPYFCHTIKEILTLLLSYLLSYLQQNFPLQPTTVPTTIPSQVPSNQPSKQNNQRERNRTRERRKKFYHHRNSNKDSTASAIYTLNNTVQQYIHLQFPSAKIQRSSLTGNPGFDSWSKRRFKSHASKSIPPKATNKASSSPYVPPIKHSNETVYDAIDSFESTMDKSFGEVINSSNPTSYFQPPSYSDSSATSSSSSNKQSSSSINEAIAPSIELLKMKSSNRNKHSPTKAIESPPSSNRKAKLPSDPSPILSTPSLARAAKLYDKNIPPSSPKSPTSVTDFPSTTGNSIKYYVPPSKEDTLTTTPTKVNPENEVPFDEPLSTSNPHKVSFTPSIDKQTSTYKSFTPKNNTNFSPKSTTRPSSNSSPSEKTTHKTKPEDIYLRLLRQILTYKTAEEFYNYTENYDTFYISDNVTIEGTCDELRLKSLDKNRVMKLYNYCHQHGATHLTESFLNSTNKHAISSIKVLRCMLNQQSQNRINKKNSSNTKFSARSYGRPSSNSSLLSLFSSEKPQRRNFGRPSSNSNLLSLFSSEKPQRPKRSTIHPILQHTTPHYITDSDDDYKINSPNPPTSSQNVTHIINQTYHNSPPNSPSPPSDIDPMNHDHSDEYDQGFYNGVEQEHYQQQRAVCEYFDIPDTTNYDSEELHTAYGQGRHDEYNEK